MKLKVKLGIIPPHNCIIENSREWLRLIANKAWPTTLFLVKVIVNKPVEPNKLKKFIRKQIKKGLA